MQKHISFLGNHANNDTNAPRGSRRGAFYFARGAFFRGGVHLRWAGCMTKNFFPHRLKSGSYYPIFNCNGNKKSVYWACGRRKGLRMLSQDTKALRTSQKYLPNKETNNESFERSFQQATVLLEKYEMFDEALYVIEKGLKVIPHANRHRDELIKRREQILKKKGSSLFPLIGGFMYGFTI